MFALKKIILSRPICVTEIYFLLCQQKTKKLQKTQLDWYEPWLWTIFFYISTNTLGLDWFCSMEESSKIIQKKDVTKNYIK